MSEHKHHHTHEDQHECCCGHEHENHDGCCHKHEHHHEAHEKHSHDHHCNCNHDHEHHHDGDCGCGHDHSHEDPNELAMIAVGAIIFIVGITLEHLSFPTLVPLALFVVAYLVFGGEILLGAGKNILRGHIFDENFLMAIATLGAFAIKEYPEAVGVMLFYRVGEYFEHKAAQRSRAQIMEAVDMRPEVVHLIVSHNAHEDSVNDMHKISAKGMHEVAAKDVRKIPASDVREIPAKDAKVGDLLLIHPGDRIPLDGIIVGGESQLDTSPLTGEPVPISVSTGSEVFSGCINTTGQLTLRVTKPLADSMVTRILNSVKHAAANKPKIDRFITRFAKVYTPCVVVAALAVAVIPSLFTGDWSYWIYTALTFLVISCPCALVLSVPLAYFSAIGAGSKKGILFKGGASIEALNYLGTVVMDKTGTLTEGCFELQQVVTTGSYTEEELLQICASCEQASTHPIAHSIVTAAKKRRLELTRPSTLKDFPGRGIIAEFNDLLVVCGNEKLLTEQDVDYPTNHGAQVLIAINGTYVGHLIIADKLKEDAASAIRELKAQKLHTVMLTGDSKADADAIAKMVEIDETYARLLPEDKLNMLEKIRGEHGGVMFIGDGINDAPVLAGADVGAAMGSGADAAIEAADAVFITSKVSSIPQALRLARHTNRIAMENVVFALAVKIGIMILGLFGLANMWLAVFADTGVAMLCVLNSIRILYKK